MATNQVRFVRNAYHPGAAEYKVLGKFQAGATQAIKVGEMLELSGGNWIPLASDQAAGADIAIAAEEIKDGDRAGYYEIIVPRPGDIFEYALAAAGNPAIGTALYWSDSETLTETAGTNILANVAGHDGFPMKQGHLSDDASVDAGTTINNVDRVLVSFRLAASYFRAINSA